MIPKIVSRIGTKFIVALDSLHTEKIVCACRKNIPPLAVGDFVKVANTSKGEGVITALEPRQNILSRPNSLNHFDKPVAANIDLMIVVLSHEPPPDFFLIDEYLVIANLYGFEILLIHNKSDIDCFDANLLQEYRKIGYKVLITNTIDGAGVDDLYQEISDKTCLFVGQSGVGKSSLINYLLPDKKLRVQSLSKLSQGKHTTSNSTLYKLANNGEIIDSPGIREFGLWKLDYQDIANGFIEIKAKSVDCKFNNCRHLKEPKCAVKQSVLDKNISEVRYKNYCLLIEQ